VVHALNKIGGTSVHKFIAVAVILLLSFSSCSKSEPGKPVHENPVSLEPPIQQKDPPTSNLPPDTDKFRVEKATIDFVADQIGNTHRVLLDLDYQGELTLFGQAYLYLEFNKAVKPETVQGISSAQLNNPFNLRISLDSNTRSIIIPAKGFPELKLDGATDFAINRGETFLLVQNWPLPRDAFEERVQKAFSTAEFTTEWLDDKTLAVTIKQSATEYGWYGLSLRGIEDTFGYKHDSNCEYSFSLNHPKVIKSIELATGRESVQGIPMAVSGAVAMDSKTNIVRLYRRTSLADAHDATDLHFSLDLNTGEVTNEVKAHRAGYPIVSTGILPSVNPDLATEEIPVYSALSPSGDKWALIYHNWKENKSYLLLLDVSTGVSERAPLSSQHAYDGGSYYLQPPIWSPDETKLVYNSLNDNEGIYAFDLLTKKESKIITEGARPLFYSPTGVLFFSSGSAYYLLDATGIRTKLSMDDMYLKLVTWVDEDRALVSLSFNDRDDECYIYSIKANRFDFTSTGTAFDYDPLTDTVYILETASD